MENVNLVCWPKEGGIERREFVTLISAVANNAKWKYVSWFTEPEDIWTGLVLCAVGFVFGALICVITLAACGLLA